MRIIGKIIAVMLLLILGGFFIFVATFPRAERFDMEAAQSDIAGIAKSDIGIVALTGGGGIRIERALRLYDENIADRVLISGTHPDVRKGDLAAFGDEEILACCVDLGTEALTTIGNGLETKIWADDHQYKAILLVTHDYHLPRAMMELRHSAPDLMIIGVPVQGKIVTAKDWYNSADAWQILAGEYFKFLLASVRTLL